LAVLARQLEAWDQRALAEVHRRIGASSMANEPLRRWLEKPGAKPALRDAELRPLPRLPASPLRRQARKLARMERRSPFKSRGGLDRLMGALRYSISGFRQAWREEAAFRQEAAVGAVLLPLALWLPVSTVERILLIGSLALVLIVELLNSAIEAVVDRVSFDRHELSKRAKDLGSAAVMLALLMAGVSWLIILAAVVVEMAE
jgi:diacylglycerol kinase (ATP)